MQNCGKRSMAAKNSADTSSFCSPAEACIGFITEIFSITAVSRSIGTAASAAWKLRERSISGNPCTTRSKAGYAKADIRPTKGNGSTEGTSCGSFGRMRTPPLYGKDKMTTFERYFLADKESYAEEKNAYYRLCDDEETVERIFREFGIDPDKGHIINGHVSRKGKKRGIACTLRRKGHHYRRRIFPRVSEGYGNCGIYIGIRFPNGKAHCT